MKRLGRSLLLCLLAVASFARPGPPGTPPPDLGLFFYQVRSQPTDAKSVNQRFRVFKAALDARGIAPDNNLRQKLAEIRLLLGQGRLTKAAKSLDQAVYLAIEAPIVTAAAAPAAAPPAAASGEEPDVAALAPALLSAPEPAVRAVAAPAATALPAGPPALPLAFAARAAQAPPEPRGPPFHVLAAHAGMVLFAVAVLIFAVSRLVKLAPKKAVAPLASEAWTESDTLTDKYSLGRLIASGGMGEVYEGRDLKLGRRVAIKRMLSDAKLDAALRSQFLNEARTVAKLSHPYIVPIHDCLERGGDLYLVFEFVEGETLAGRLTREARLSLKESRRIMRYVCAAVDHAHKNHVLHRDLKPANIMLDSEGIARVMDFGIALESTRAMTVSTPAFLDSSGTLRYMPPEQHYGKSVRASDIYAMGVCLYEMTTGHPPFSAGTPEELIEAKRSRRYPAPCSLRSELPKEFDLFIAAALAPDAQNRISSAPEFLELLDAIPV
jgi:tRNA A-37 threonylcarbamoyl transferase component Bud32